MINLLVRILVLFVSIFSSWQMIADEAKDLCQIEILFFEHTDAKRFEFEIWPKFIGKLDTRKAIKIGEPNPASIVSVDSQKMLLQEEARILKKSKTQRFIQQVSWTQPVDANIKSIPVYIQAGKNNEEIEAVVDIRPARNLFSVSLDFIYKIGDQEFRVTRDLKLKKKEVYYVDHPVVGAMLVISPLG